MLVTSITARNYRVFKDLELELPPGLVGIFGPNGSGKSSLLEAIIWSLYGRSRSGKGEIRSAGEAGECFVELGFVHEDNYYEVRRTLTGKNATIKARVTTAQEVVADGVSDVAKYIHSLLGLDDLAFRSSVFAEQKQLAAFSDQTPEQRRKLVLQLLGITPIEKARDAARSDAKARHNEYAALAAILGSLDALESRRTEAESEVANLASELELTRLTTERTGREAEKLRNLFEAQRAASEASDRIMTQGAAVRKRRDQLGADIKQLEIELDAAVAASTELAALREEPESDLASLVLRRSLLGDYQRLVDQLSRLPKALEIEPGDQSALDALREAHNSLSQSASGISALHEASRRAVERARKQLDQHERLTVSDLCPVCGQSLGQGFADVISHSRQDFESAVAEETRLSTESSAAQKRVTEIALALRAAESSLKAAVKAQNDAALASQRRSDLEGQLAAIGERLIASGVDDFNHSQVARLDGQIETLQVRQQHLARLVAICERAPDVRERHKRAQSAAEDAEIERRELLAELKNLAFDASGFDELRTHRDQAERAFAAAQASHRNQELLHAKATSRLAEILNSLEDARSKQEKLSILETDARYLARTAELMTGFRHAVVAGVGPQLSSFATTLFQDLTGGDYEGIEINPDDYSINVIDGGVAYGLDRFSGSEVDLANLSLRVSISEHIRFRSGGQVGLLVLDEALASLDGDRKHRMLLALQRLAGRFQQILVVTHSAEVKELMPQSIEVVRVGHRSSIARLVEVTSG